MQRADALVRVLAFTVMLLIPIRIVGEGFLPPDDALRHAGKAVSGRDWSEVLVLRPEITMDSHPGWHALLRGIHLATGASAHSLVLVAVIGLFLLFSVPALVLLRRPEAWLLASLVLLLLEPRLVARMLLGRPFVVTATAVAALCLLWPRLREPSSPWPTLTLLTGVFALATWIHGSWYLLCLPVACFFLARQWRAAWRALACVGLGVLLGALLTGRPLAYLAQAVLHGYLALGETEPSGTLVMEFRPFGGSPLVVAAALALLAWRARRGRPVREVVHDPVFVLAFVGWTLGFVAVRFFSDWAGPALLVLIARELDEALGAMPAGEVAPRLATAGLAGGILFLALTADTDSRWTGGASEKFLALDNPAHAPWLPEPGGILYSADMTLFYRTFFRNPDAPWRYVLGYEPGLMPSEDLAIYRDIRRSRGATESYAAWVRKMTPADRLFIRMTTNVPPPVPGLEWYQPEFAVWSGRLPKSPPPAPGAPPSP